MKKLNLSLKNPIVSYIGFGGLLMLVPVLILAGVLRNSTLTLVASVIFYSIAALGLNVLLGWSGLVSLGTAGFMGLAAYISAYLTHDLKLPFELALVAAVIIPTLIGILVGFISLRIEGLYLAIATLAVSEILRKTFEVFDFFTGGYSGKPISFPTILGFITQTPANRTLFPILMYTILVIFLVAVMILIHNLMKGQFGRALNAMRGSEAAAQAMGINLLKYRLMAFGLATALASLSGVLYVHFIKYTHPGSWTLALSLNLVAAIIIGGARNIYGTILGVFVVFAMPDLILKQIPYFGTIPNFAFIVNGILIIIVIMYYPYGLIQITKDFKKIWLKLKERFS